ncbi:alginate O-acetyltransferase AlgX-related protein [Aquimarina sp. 2304DJ70-9]|uniref:alginate O-acetyltransferase AlgX-related protein n=1 Tax=Aquimarina penaris TaxID=3231044 RepID=UPI0034619255
MKRFLTDIFYFTSFVIVVLLFIEIIVPENAITHSPLEANKVKSKDLFVGPFYPNNKMIRDGYGDLAHHTKHAILKKDIVWDTDELGFRNKHVIEFPDVIFLGTSNIAGYSTSQEQNISNQVSHLTGLSTYNIAPYSFDKFTQLLDAQIINKPKILVYGLIERGLPFLPEIKQPNSGIKNLFLKLKNTTIFNGLARCIDIPAKRSFQRFIIARINKATGNGIQSDINKKMFFFQGKYSKIDATDEVVQRTADVISLYRDYCKEKGIEFVFFPIPNKETLYYELIPFEEQPSYLNKLYTELKKRDIHTINTLEVFNQEKQKQLLYHFDDTHWNVNGIAIAAKDIAKCITNLSTKQ